ncbi:MFS transporter [Desulfovibrio porci]|uniref:MFS transporter n=1 Tax=Desulfovibrio porci TaxID=2605782 RepID=UPI001E3A3464|nr:MFS transporter [Desulfovibrio porci]
MPDRRIRRQQAANTANVGTWRTLREICNRNFSVVTLINLLVMTAYYLIFVTSTAYARDAFAASLSTAGFTAGIMVIGCLVGRFVTGNLLSIFGCRMVLFAGLLLYVVSMAGFFLVDSLGLLLAQRFWAGVGVGVIGTATGTIVAYVIPQRHHGFGVSLFSMSTALALALGPFLGITLSTRIGYATLMWVNVGIALVCMLIFFGLAALPSMRHRHRSFFSLNSYIDPRVVRFSLVALVVCLSYGCVQAFMTSFAAERALSGPASLFFLLYAVAALATRPLTGRLFDTRGENVIFYPILLLTALSLILLARAESGWMLLLAGLVLGMASATSSPWGRPYPSRWSRVPALPRPPRPFSSFLIWASAWVRISSVSWCLPWGTAACTRRWPLPCWPRWAFTICCMGGLRVRAY